MQTNGSKREKRNLLTLVIVGFEQDWSGFRKKFAGSGLVKVLFEILKEDGLIAN